MISPKQKIICQELNTGKAYNGFFYFNDKTIKAEICSFNETFYIKEETPIFLQSEDNYIISLHSNISSPAGTNWRKKPEMQTHKQVIISNTAVVGHDKWQKTDLIKRASFYIKNSDDLLKHKKTFDSHIKSKWNKKIPFDIFSIYTNNMNVRVSYSATFTSEFNEPRKILPRFEIEFEEPVTLFEYLEHVKCVVQFFSLSLGAYLTPADFTICKLSFKDMIAAVHEGIYLGDYSVKYVWSEIYSSDSDLWIGGSLVIARDDDELKNLKNCLIFWISHYAVWRKASIQMMCCLSLRNEISPDRLLAACKWFEEIPQTNLENVVNDEHIKKIAKAASEKAVELGYEDFSKRISGALKSIKSETNKARFRRLFKLVKDKFGITYIDENEMVSYLEKALEFRGKVAHGHFDPSDDQEFHIFLRATYAMEAFCFLITVYSLPINENGIKRMRSNPFITNYLFA